MKIRSRAARTTLVAALAIAAVFVVVSPALGALEDVVDYTSTTNPGVGETAFWRWNWGNDPHPQLTATNIPQDGLAQEDTIGMLYSIRQLGYLEPLTPVPGAQVPDWSSSSLSIMPNQTTFTGVYDLSAVAARHGWTPTPGTTKPGEGLYRITHRWFNQFRLEDAGAVDVLQLGIDMTPPQPVDGLTDSVNQVDGTGVYTEATWRDLRWDIKAYDALSGVGGFAINVSGQDEAFVANVAPDPAYEPYASMLTTRYPDRDQLSHVTIEDLKPGVNTISVTTVDRATNRATPRTIKAYVDSDTPSLKYLKPANLLAARIQTFSVDATDQAGISKVSFYIDNVLVGTVTKKPFDLGLDLTNYTQGQHTLKVVAEDMIGFRSGPWIRPHTAEVVKTITIDNKAPSLTINSAGPQTFYPRKRDGYKDNFVTSFTTDEPGTAYLTVYNSNGKVYRQMSKAVSAGTSSFAWDGKSSSGGLAEADFKVRVTMYDAAGNWRSSDKYTAKIRFTELVRISANQVKVVQR